MWGGGVVVRREVVGALVSGFVARSRVNLTHSALKSSPLWNLTPLRNVNCQVVAFARFHVSARPGPRLPWPPRAVRPSHPLALKICVLRPTAGSGAKSLG